MQRLTSTPSPLQSPPAGSSFQQQAPSSSINTSAIRQEAQSPSLLLRDHCNTNSHIPSPSCSLFHLTPSTTTYSYSTPPTRASPWRPQQQQCAPPTLIPPHSNLARALLMGNVASDGSAPPQATTAGDVRSVAMTTNSGRQEGGTRTYVSNGRPIPPPTTSCGPHHPPAGAYPENQTPPKSNLSALLEHEQQQHNNKRHLQQVSHNHRGPAPLDNSTTSSSNHASKCDCMSNSTPQAEADSASGPPPAPACLGHSAPSVILSSTLPPGFRRGTPPSVLLRNSASPRNKRGSTGTLLVPSSMVGVSPGGSGSDKVRRCISSKELGTLAPPSGSPYLEMLRRKEVLEEAMTERLRTKRDLIPFEQTAPRHTHHNLDGAPVNHGVDTDVSCNSSCSQQSGGACHKHGAANKDRNKRRAAHHQAVVEELCEVVADLFIAESKLLNPSAYGVPQKQQSQSSSPSKPTPPRFQREQVLKSVQNFVSALPTRYALGADTPSEVLLHMRLMAVARSDPTRAVVHIINLENDSYWTDNCVREKHSTRKLRLVTIVASDADGLLEYLTRLLGTGGSRVLDADVMLSTDRIALDRFVVEMNGRLRLDKLANLIESFLKKRRQEEGEQEDERSAGSQDSQSFATNSGTLYYNPPLQRGLDLPSQRDLQEEIEGAVPLTEVLASPVTTEALLNPNFQMLRRHFSMPSGMATQTPNPGIFTPVLLTDSPRQQPQKHLADDENGLHNPHLPPPRVVSSTSDAATSDSESLRHKRPLVNRHAAADLDRIGIEDQNLDFVTVPSSSEQSAFSEGRDVPLIPFQELMLIETIGMGRVSTIYRAAWQSHYAPDGAQMVALKVAMVNQQSGDTSHIDELRREADIAARLQHPNICDLVGVAADAECFCLAYDYCEGGSLLSLISDTSRYYEYLPIALDIASGMAYLHSRDVIHRDLKPSNILLTREHRARISDFGMSVANRGQELTAETGTYRYMAPEVIRHESYSSNADVYSFGICLWQLITRQVPFRELSPVQAAYAVAEGNRPEIPSSTPRRLKEIIEACWEQDSYKRPSFTYIALALADYVKLAFSPANVGAQTLQIANDMLATVEGNSNVNVDFTAPVTDNQLPFPDNNPSDYNDVGLEI